MQQPASEPTGEANDVDLTPMLDVVFIMLIFFLVTASFVRETGLDVAPPTASPPEPTESANVLVGISASDEFFVAGRSVDRRTVGANVIAALADDPEATVVIRADAQSTTAALVLVIDELRRNGIGDYALARLE
ncbi:MAG: biopolymer transporter ExbD [Pseudomonadota bacterium]